MFDNIKDGITRKFRDIKKWIVDIPDNETYVDFQTITRGLFFVYIYGLYEEIIRETVIEATQEINNAQITVSDCSVHLYPLVFSNEFDSMYGVGNEKKWEKRWELVDKITTNPVVHLNDAQIPTDGKNIKVRQLESIFKSFGIQADALSRPEVGGYIQEMVENRNHIAHGNLLPHDIGKRFTKADLLKRCEIISEECSYVVTQFESFIAHKHFLSD